MEDLNQKLGLSAKNRFGEIIPTSATAAVDWQEGHAVMSCVSCQKSLFLPSKPEHGRKDLWKASRK